MQAFVYDDDSLEEQRHRLAQRLWAFIEELESIEDPLGEASPLLKPHVPVGQAYLNLGALAEYLESDLYREPVLDD